MRIRLISCIPLFLILITSCVTEEDPGFNTESYFNNTSDKLEKYLDNSDYERVIVETEILMNDDTLDQDFRNSLVSYRKKAETGLSEHFEKALNGKDYDKAISLLSSLRASGIESEYSLAELAVKQTLALIEDNETGRGLIYFLDRIINNNLIDNFDDTSLKLIYEAAVGQRNKAVLEYLTKDLAYVPSQAANADKIMKDKPQPYQMLKGTATIWVNRGIKIESGVGYPDRVIGSGFFIDKHGYLLTNYHVISSEVDPEYEGYSRLYIKTDNSDVRIPAEVIGWDSSLDIALLKTGYEPEYIFNFSKTRTFTPGEKIYAIGSPGGLEKTITSGIISASGDRRLLPIGDTIQVDVPINAGNSGGPVIDENGDLVGVVFAGIEQFEGVNFIIPSRWIVHALPELFKGGKMKKSWIGLAVYESHNADSESLEILYTDKSSSAAKWGLKPKDKLVSMAGIKVNGIADAQEILISRAPGTILETVMLTEQGERSMLLLTEERPAVPLASAVNEKEPYDVIPALFGMQISEGNSTLLNREYIVDKVYPGMSADETGLSINDPFSISSWYYDDKNEIILMNLKIKKRKAGFLEAVIQLGSYLDINRVL